MGSAETSQQLEELFDDKKKRVKNPFVPIGACLLPILFLFFYLIDPLLQVTCQIRCKHVCKLVYARWLRGLNLGKFHLGLFDVANRLLLK